MSIRSAKDVIAIVRSRGLEIKLEPGFPPKPVLVPGRSKDAVSPALIEALKAWKAEIVDELRSTLPKPTQRILAIDADDGWKGPGKVVWEGGQDEDVHELARKLRPTRAERWLAAEWWHDRGYGMAGWERFLLMEVRR